MLGRVEIFITSACLLRIIFPVVGIIILSSFSIEGHVCCVEEGSVSIDLTKLNEIMLPPDGFLDDFYVRVGAGVHRLHLNEELRHTGLQFMVDPGADATIGTDNINGKIDCIEKLIDFAIHILSAEIPPNLSCDKFPSL